jgi:hypothetical protein
MKRVLSFFLLSHCAMCTHLYLMEISADIHDTDPNVFCDQFPGPLYNLTGIDVKNQIDCQSSLPRTVPSSPPTVCSTELECQVPIHHTYRRNLHIDDPYHVDCSVWLNKKCSSAAEFIRVHNCSNIEVCAGCCLLDSPPPASPSGLLVDSEYPVWVVVTMISLIIGGLAVCTSVLLVCNCFSIAKDVLHYCDLTARALEQYFNNYGNVVPKKNIVQKNERPVIREKFSQRPVIRGKLSQTDRNVSVKKLIRPPSTRKIIVSLPNVIWPRAPVVDLTRPISRPDVSSAPMIRFSSQTEFEVRPPTRRSTSVPKSRAHIRSRV